MSKTYHDTFKIERTFDAPPARLFKAHADVKAKARWFGGPPDWDSGELQSDFRVGGKEYHKGGPKGGFVSEYSATYLDIVPNERIIISYEMTLDGKKMSVSLATTEFIAAGPGGKATKMVFTEQGTYLDEFALKEHAAGRKEGSEEIFNALEKALKEGVAA
jgi:uncharacterized protein YndB with AHSA1/START domain